jgi:hypothetical protein
MKRWTVLVLLLLAAGCDLAPKPTAAAAGKKPPVAQRAEPAPTGAQLELIFYERGSDGAEVAALRAGIGVKLSDSPTYVRLALEKACAVGQRETGWKHLPHSTTVRVWAYVAEPTRPLMGPIGMARWVESDGKPCEVTVDEPVMTAAKTREGVLHGLSEWQRYKLQNDLYEINEELTGKPYQRYLKRLVKENNITEDIMLEIATEGGEKQWVFGDRAVAWNVAHAPR